MAGHRPCLFGRGVGADVGGIRADPDGRQIDAATFPDRLESIVIRGVSAIENAPAAGLEQIGVVAAVLIVERSGAPVHDLLSRHG